MGDDPPVALPPVPIPTIPGDPTVASVLPSDIRGYVPYVAVAVGGLLYYFMLRKKRRSR